MIAICACVMSMKRWNEMSISNLPVNFSYGEQENYPQISGINADFLIGENLC